MGYPNQGVKVMKVRSNHQCNALATAENSDNCLHELREDEKWYQEFTNTF